MKRMILLAGVLVFLVGCAGRDRLYYWGNYSQSLYKYKKAPTPENMEAHKKTLVTIIEESRNRNKKVPPGVCCEYGYILLKEGNSKDGLYYFDLEEQLYPESKVFVGRLKDHLVKKEDKP